MSTHNDEIADGLIEEVKQLRDLVFTICVERDALRADLAEWKDLARDMKAERASMYESIATLKADLAAARALLLEANLWVREFDDDRDADSLYERIHAALAREKNDGP